MALSKVLLAGRIKTNVQAVWTSTQSDAWLTSFCQAVANAVVDEIQANAQVATTDTGTVTSGVGAGGTVSATGAGTVT